MILYFSIALFMAVTMLTILFATDNKHPFGPVESLIISCVIGIIWPASIVIGTCWFLGKWIKRNYIEGDSNNG